MTQFNFIDSCSDAVLTFVADNEDEAIGNLQDLVKCPADWSMELIS